MNNLLDRGLIKVTGRLDVPGRPMLYGTTSDFLRYFGLSDLDSLPTTSDELIEVFEGARAEQDAKIESFEEDISNGEQLTLDIENIMDSPRDEEASENQTIDSSDSDTSLEESVEFEDPSADDDIHED